MLTEGGSIRIGVAIAALALAAPLLGACAEPAPDALVPDRRSVASTIDREHALLPAPIHPTLHLVDWPARVFGTAGAVDPTVAQFTREDLAGWKQLSETTGVQFVGVFADAGLADVGEIEITVSPGGADRILITPFLDSDQREARQRGFRQVEIPVPATEPGQPLTLNVDLGESLHGNWGDASRSTALHKLEIALLGADPEQARLDEIRFYAWNAIRLDSAGGRGIDDYLGILRPAWLVRGGARIELDVLVPQGSPELRWESRGVDASGARTVAIEVGGQRTVLASSTTTSPVPEAQSLERWAGRQVRLEFAASGEGVGVFVDPRILSPAPRSRAPDVIVYLIDALRADALGSWSGEQPSPTPVLDRIASEGIRFARALSHSSWTKPAIPTLLTGILPTAHRVGAGAYSDRLPEGVPLVQELFRQAGWRTGSFSASVLGSTLSGLERGFGTAVPPRHWKGRARLGSHPSARQLHAAFLGWLDEEPDQSVFAFLHTLDVHQWERFRKQPREGRRPYRVAVRDADRKLGELLEELERRGRTDDLLLIVVSDHGEGLGDNGFSYHGRGLFQSQIHVPLIVWAGEGFRASVVAEPVGLSDVVPTLLEVFGMSVPDSVDGVSLRPALTGGRPPAREGISSALLRYIWAPDAPQQFSVVAPSGRKIIRKQSGETSVFDLERDPLESRPLPVESVDSDLTTALERLREVQQQRARAFAEDYGPADASSIGSDGVDQLRSLGYIE